jgi:uncharacterized membrane protein HdeD (DUF308 family)
MDERRDGERLRAAAMGARERLGGLWWTFMIRGVLALLLGLCALFWPSATVELLITLVGVFCVVDGLTGLLGVFRTPERGANLVPPLVGLAIGLVLLFWPDATVRTLLVVFGAWLVFVGITQILGARRANLQGGDRSVMTTIGGVAAVVGLILVLWPGTGVVAISWVIAIPALVVAALLIFLALRLKRVDDRSRGIEP